ncbi:MAG: aminotransferase class I/II-fold pyridoxal phosphate-dependent enzyme [Alphaproteobacteria bacterium]|jgi:8-amino-7-oxononanoate synthase
MISRYDPPMTLSLDQHALQKLAEIEAKTLTRRLSPTTREQDARVTRGKTGLIAFCDNDYLGLSQHPALKQAAIDATEKYGAGTGASRLITGDNPLYTALESRIARIKGTQAAIVFGSGYLANIGIIPAFVGPGDLIVADELSHACMHGGATLSGSDIRFFAHNDAQDCAKILAENRAHYKNVLVMTEGVFSMDGDCAPIDALSALTQDMDCWLLVDDAHALGVINQGRGSGFAKGDHTPIDLHMGTLSKAAGAYGGYLAASRAAIDLMVNRARSLIFTTALPPGVLAAAEKGLELIETDAELVSKPIAKARLFTDALGLKPAESAVVPLIIGDEALALSASSALEKEGFLVTAIRPPTVPKGTARLRVTFSAAHADDDVLALARAITKLDLASV